jgi:3-hydroxy acid dehydrogenase/malonic semialdehyde reductase
MNIQSLLSHPLDSLAGNTALVTGASAGIGLATAVLLAEESVNLVLVARREDKLSEVADAIRKHFPNIVVSAIYGSISDQATIKKIEIAGGLDAQLVINNAGLALGVDPVESAQLSDWEEMIDTNVKAVFELTRNVLPRMLLQKNGHIVQLGSIAGHYSYEGGSVYCATKHALLAFTKALRLETCGKGIRITTVSPGLVETEFSEVRFRGDKTRAKKVYEGISALKSTDIARQIIWALKQPKYVNIDEIVLMPDAQGGPQKVVRR